ncbi:MAG: hypothetical protein LBE67_11745 [Kocuria palustris]|nr:hypothetical protein [Kocuria palustris]
MGLLLLGRRRELGRARGDRACPKRRWGRSRTVIHRPFYGETWDGPRRDPEIDR